MFPSAKTRNYLVAFLAGIFTVLVYLPALQNEFVNWDDYLYVYENPNIQSLGLKSLKWMFTAFHASNWHPLTWLSHALDYAIWGLNPMGHHLTSILIHGLNTFLVVIVIVKLIEKSPHPLFCKEGKLIDSVDKLLNSSFKKGKDPAVPPFAKGGEGGFSGEMLGSGGNAPLMAGAVTGLLFGLHPLHVESVAWVSERKDVLYAFFYMLSILAYLKYVSSPPFNSPLTKGGYRGVRGWHWYSICLLFFILSLMSKPMAVTLPLVLIILDIYPLGRLGFAKERIRKTPSPLPSPRGIGGEGCNISPPLMGGDEGEGGLFSGQRKVLLEKIPFIALSIVSSIITIKAQQAGKSFPHLIAQDTGDRISAAIRALAFYLYKMVLPEGIVPYYPYPARVSLFSMEYIVSCCLAAGITAVGILMWKRHKVVLAAWVYYVVSLMPVLGIVQVGTQLAAVRYTYMPMLGPFLLIGIGITTLGGKALLKEGLLNLKKLVIFIGFIFIFSIMVILTIKQINMWKNSFNLWNTEIKEFPYVSLAYRNLGVAYAEKEDYREAMEKLNKSIELNPADELSYFNRGIVYGKSGFHDKAIEDFKMAITLDPSNAKFYNNLGVTYGVAGEYQQAIKNFNTAINFDPLFSKAYYHRGIAYNNSGINSLAFQDFMKAANLGDRDAQNYLKAMGLLK